MEIKKVFFPSPWPLKNLRDLELCSEQHAPNRQACAVLNKEFQYWAICSILKLLFSTAGSRAVTRKSSMFLKVVNVKRNKTKLFIPYSWFQRLVPEGSVGSGIIHRRFSWDLKRATSYGSSEKRPHGSEDPQYSNSTAQRTPIITIQRLNSFFVLDI